jgi:hypothetical protein
MNFLQEFIVHPVGQGLFYTGRINLEINTGFRLEFYMVFDCGSIDRDFIGLEVKSYLENLDRRRVFKLDLLVISHFDKDHVSHIKHLVSGRKIMRLVMPFLGFAERLVLALQILESSSGAPDPGDLAIAAFILDPIGSLGDSLDGDSHIYLVESGGPPNDPDNLSILPQEPTLEQDGETVFQEKNRREPRNLLVDYPEKKRFEDDGSFGSGGRTAAKVFKVSDKFPAELRSDFYHLMEFIFYKKSLGVKEASFYEEVRRLFMAEFGASTFQQVLNALQLISNARPIKEIFRRAARKFRMKVTKIKDLNTSSLCMLHRNLPGIHQLLGVQQVSDLDRVPYSYGYRSMLFRRNKQEDWIMQPCSNHYIYIDHDNKFCFPDTLLTSDAPLLEPTDLDHFKKHYQGYLQDVYLLQVPHHGSEKSSGLDFFNLTSSSSECHNRTHYFCNFGLHNTFGHPNGVVKGILKDLPAERYFAVHEIIGICNTLNFYKY